MNFNLKTDINFKLTKEEIENDIDSLIDYSKNNLTLKITKEIKAQEDIDQQILKDILQMIYTDLESKRIHIKKFFIEQLENITKAGYEEALKKFNNEIIIK